VEVNNPLNTEDSQSSDSVVPTQPISTPDDLYWETDDTNPNQIIYDLENDEIIIPTDEDIITTPTLTDQTIIKKIVSRNVGNTRRRRFR